jgi:putative ABC transport system ATP-binding protein
VLQLEPRVLLLDEFSASLDADAVRRAEALLVRWLEESPGRGLLLTSHDARQLDRFSTRRLTLGGAP